jgi:putative transposase
MPHLDVNARRLRLVEQVLRLPDERLMDVEKLLAVLPAAALPAPVAASRDWPHAPLHRLSEAGTYIVTAGTYERQHHFAGSARLDHLENALLTAARAAGWQLEAWAVFSNHYHFIGHAQADAESLSEWLKRLHRDTANYANELDKCLGRRVWYNFWETHLTFEKSYLARLNYVHQNAVKHGLVRVANQYRWCSAARFERTATRAQVRTIYAFKTDQLKVYDDFEPI